MRVTVYMIHCEIVYDLLAKGLNVANSQRNVRIDDRGSITGLRSKGVPSLAGLQSVVSEAKQERRRLSAKLNDHQVAKKSHFIVQLQIV